jgi:hypothetical protein
VSHWVHVELSALVQVIGETQPSTGVHSVQTVGSVPDLQYPSTHKEQFELVALVQVSVEAQWSTPVHGRHACVDGSR